MFPCSSTKPRNFVRIPTGALSLQQCDFEAKTIEDFRKKHKRIWSNGLNRNFSEEELEKFFSAIDNESHLLCFQLQAYLGLRISEAVKVKLDDIDFKNKQIRVYSPKTGMIDFLPLHEKIHDILASWVRKYHTSIQEFGGHLLFSNKHYSRRQAPDYLTKNYMRKVFRGYLKKAGLDTVYATLKTDGNQPGEKRRLYRLSTHSLRHYFITRIYKTSLNPVVTQALARHRAFGTTQNYINLTKKDCQQAMEKAFTTTQEEPKRGGLESPKIQEFLMFYEAWKGHISKG